MVNDSWDNNILMEPKSTSVVQETLPYGSKVQLSWVNLILHARVASIQAIGDFNTSKLYKPAAEDIKNLLDLTAFLLSHLVIIMVTAHNHYAFGS